MSDTIEAQLNKVEYADLSNFDKKTMSGIIPKRSDIKIEADGCYLIRVHRSFFNNQTIALNWNHGSFPPSDTLQIDVLRKVGNMILVNANCISEGSNYQWSGWLSIDEFTTTSKL